MSTVGGGLVAKTLKEFGVRHLFSLPGHQILSVYDACQEENLDLITTRHELSAVYMAQGLAIAGQQPGVALLAGGPELTNALTAIAQAFYAGTPMVVISGANTLQKRDKGFPQDMDQLQVVRPFTKWARSCHDARRIPEYIAAAYRQAVRGRPGPAYLEIPYDVMETKINLGEVVFPERPGELPASGAKSSLELLAKLLMESERPVAIAGSGAKWSGCGEELAAFIQHTRIPLILANAGMAMPFEPKEVFGMVGLGVSRPTTTAITEADLILLLGTRLNFVLGFGQPPFISSSQRIVQVDIEPEETGSNRLIDLGISGDLREILEELNQMELPMPDIERWRKRLKQKIERYASELEGIAASANEPIHPLRLVLALESARTDDSTLVLDGANSILWMMMVMKPHPRGGIVVSSAGELQAIGAGVPHALAIKRAYPDRQVILHTGDGSFGYGIMEIETAVRYDIPLTVVVHNDSGWGMTRDMQEAFFGDGREQGNRLGVVRYDQVVQALGGHGELVEKAEEIQPALDRALQSGLPACVNVMVDPKPKSPGLMTFMMMEVMLGKSTYYDRIPDWMRKLQSFGLEGAATKTMLSYLDRMLHREMGGKTG
jgi:acetolactate synthase-1/2/3 large subunit